MNLYTEAVETALNLGKTKLAIEYANKGNFREYKRKRIWMNIALHLLGEGGGNNMEEVQWIINNEINIEDLLLHFHENTKIGSFKDYICDSL